MEWFVHIHDEWILWFIQKVFFEYQVLWIAVMLVVLVCLPTHRLSARGVGWFGVAWALVCLFVYGALVEAPWLGWFLVILLVYRFARWLFWSTPASTATKRNPRRPNRSTIPGAWTTAMVRDYLRADPRAVYWLDLARAVRGLPITRTGKDRRASLTPNAELPDWRHTVWQFIFRFVELRIWVYRRLPRYWHRPHTRLDLGEDHLRQQLEHETERAHQNMMRSWTGNTFTEYSNRSPRTRKHEQERAARFGRASCLLSEALAEYYTFREPWQPGEKLLVDAAMLTRLTWRRRCRHDILWHRDSESVGASTDREAAEPEVTEPDTHDDLLPDEAPPEVVTPASGSAVVVSLDEKGDGERSSPEDEISVAAREPDDEAHEPVEPDETEELREARQLERRDEPDEPTNDQTPPREKDLVEERFAALNELLRPPPDPDESAASMEEPDIMSDDQLFDVVVPIDADETDREMTTNSSLREVRLSPCQWERLANLRTASSMLEAYLDLEPTGKFADDVDQAERLLTHPKRRMAAGMLLMLYCLRSDYAGPGVDALLVELLARLDEQLFNRDAQRRQSVAERRLLLSMQIDLMFQRREYSRVVEFFSRYDDLGRYECQMLANAEASVAAHLAGQDELRDMLRYDAIGHYFRAGFRGIWTIEYARTLIDQLSGPEELLDLFREHPVDIGRPEMLHPPRSWNIRVLLSAGDSIKGKAADIRELPCPIGKSTPTGICLRNMDIADVHILLQDRDGSLIARDVSRRGMSVNSTKVKAARLKQGDLLKFGNVSMKIEAL